MPTALRFKQWKTPKQPGERARLKVVHGSDNGSLFVITAEKVTIGRGDENDVIFADVRASRKHAELTRLPSGTWRLRDLGSQNGVICNGRVTRETDINAGDVITVGETAFEFVTDESGTRFLHTPAKMLPPEYLAGRAVAVVAPKASAPAPRSVASTDMSGLSGIAGIGAASGGTSSSGEKRKKILMGAVIAMGLWLFLDDAPPKPTKDPKQTKLAAEKKKKEAERDLASYLPAMPNGVTMSSAETFFQEGFREFREKNYLRARVQFETALQISPSHSQAKHYLQQADQAISEDVLMHLERGRRDLDAGKLKSARAHFEAVQRLLARDPENPSFLEAKDQLRSVFIRSRKGGSES